MSEVCSKCFEDPDLIARIEEADGEPGCSFCGKTDAPTIDLGELAEFMQVRLEQFYSYGENELYHDRESDYGLGGTTYTTYELLSDELALELPRDHDAELRTDLAYAISDQIWCDYDPALIDQHEAMVSDWEAFCEMAKADFERVLAPDVAPKVPWDDTRTPAEFLADTVRTIERRGLIVTLPAGQTYRRARERSPGEHFVCPTDLGPPPPPKAAPNRMSREGDPLFYLSESAMVALQEIHAEFASIRTFTTDRPMRVLDLVNLPTQPGVFSEAPRDDWYDTRFLRFFSVVVSQPISLDNKANYAWTQAVTWYLRHRDVGGAPLDGIRYASATNAPGSNVVLFVTQDAVLDAGTDPTTGWIRLIDACDEQAALQGEQEVQAEARQRAIDEARRANLGPLFNQE